MSNFEKLEARQQAIRFEAVSQALTGRIQKFLREQDFAVRNTAAEEQRRMTGGMRRSLGMP